MVQVAGVGRHTASFGEEAPVYLSRWARVRTIPSSSKRHRNNTTDNESYLDPIRRTALLQLRHSPPQARPSPPLHPHLLQPALQTHRLRHRRLHNSLVPRRLLHRHLPMRPHRLRLGQINPKRQLHQRPRILPLHRRPHRALRLHRPRPPAPHDLATAHDHATETRPLRRLHARLLRSDCQHRAHGHVFP